MSPQQRKHMLAVLAAAFSRAKLRAANYDHGALIIERILEEAGFSVRRKKQITIRSLQPSAAGADGGVQA
jgi:hypothetical protein